MSDAQWFVINNIKQFTNKLREMVYSNFGKWEDIDSDQMLLSNIDPGSIDDMDAALSYKESVVIVKSLVRKQKHKSTHKIRYILNDDLFVKVIESLNQRMVSNILNSLVQKGLVESAFDTEKNDFIFWIKDNKDEKFKTDSD